MRNAWSPVVSQEQQSEFVPARTFLNDSRLHPFVTRADAQQNALLLAHLHTPRMMQFLNQQLGIHLEEYSLRSQLHLLRYLENKGKDGFQRLHDTVAARRSDAGSALFIDCFFACSEDLKLGDSLVRAAERLTAGQLDPVLKKYQEIAKSVDEVERFVRQRFDGSEFSSSDLAEVRGRLLSRSNQILIQSFEQPALPVESISQLNRASKDVYLFGEIFKKLSQETGVSLQQLRSVDIAAVNASDLDPKDRHLIEVVGRERCLERYGSEGYSLPYGELLDAMKHNDNTFYLLKVEGSLVAFIRTTAGGRAGNVYLGSLNNDPLYNGYQFGMSLLSLVIQELGPHATLEGYVHESNIGPRAWYKRMGFVETENERDAAGEPTGYIRIERKAADATPTGE